MSAILLFGRDDTVPSFRRLSESLVELLGLEARFLQDGTSLAPADVDGADEPLSDAHLHVELPDLEEDEGEPTIHVAVTPRDDRDPAIQELINEILRQEPRLKESLEGNRWDILLSFEDSSAAVEAGVAFAYIYATETGSGVLVRGEDEDAETLWFADAEDFADFVFGDDEEDGDLPDEDAPPS